MTREGTAEMQLASEDAAQVAEIRADIEETQFELGTTLNELGDRLDPSHLAAKAKHNVREATIGRLETTTRGISDMVMDTIKRNPIPATMVGVGLAMLWKNRSEDAQGYRAVSHRDRGPDLGSRVGDAASTAGQGVGDAASAVGQTVGGAVGAVAEGAQQATGEVIDRAGATAQQVGWRLDSFMNANPLAVGAIAVGAGALVGSLVPETEQEREMLGDASRQLSSAVRDTVEQAATKAEETIDRAEDKVGPPA